MSDSEEEEERIDALRIMIKLHGSSLSFYRTEQYWGSYGMIQYTYPWLLIRRDGRRNMRFKYFSSLEAKIVKMLNGED